ncbi:Cysteine desulfurase / selenocysteine lyase [Candidatus Nanohalovita haloferacivicina]|nr:Cysteine desulfurase / selenocysteine lyase [Candidatus Nanohalobia archaeon BNXNv]
MREEDFPVLQNREVTYLDSACMSLRPERVIQSVEKYYRDLSSCPGRSSHKLGRETGDRINKARATVSDFIDAGHKDIAFTSGTTEALNLAAKAFSNMNVVVSDKEHNSNLVPWQKNNIDVLKTDDGIDLQALSEKVDENTVVSLHHKSNIDGSELPVEEISEIVHEKNGYLVVDAAQSISHRPVSVNEINPDVLAFSGHKMFGPSGTGVLYVSDRAKELFRNVKTGGGAVKNTTFQEAEFKSFPSCVEAGLPNAAGIIGLGTAVEYIEEVGIGEIESHEQKLSRLIRQKTREIEGLKIVGDHGTGVFSFSFDNVGAHQVSEMLDRKDIAVRSGRHCVHSWFNSRDIEPSFRASLHMYNTEEDIERLFEVLKQISVLN